MALLKGFINQTCDIQVDFYHAWLKSSHTKLAVTLHLEIPQNKRRESRKHLVPWKEGSPKYYL